MVYGYARVSTKRQERDGNSLEAQQRQLTAAGARMIYTDAFTGTSSQRPGFTALLEELTSGDTMIVTKLDRIARSITGGIALIDEMLAREVTIHVLNMGLIDNTPTGRLTKNILLAIAEFERDMIVERTIEGKMIARQNPDYQEGRPRVYSDEDAKKAVDLMMKHRVTDVSAMTGISRSTLYRFKKLYARNWEEIWSDK